MFRRIQKKIKQKLLLLALLTPPLWGGWEGCCFSQDIHFSQYYSSPLNLNPALTGTFDGECRLTAIDRSQWFTVTTPYQTYGASIEASHIMKKIKGFNLGFSAYGDKAGDSRFSTLMLNLSLSYIFKLNRDSTHILSFGIQSGVSQRKLDYTNLSFDNQYNGFYYDPSLNKQEVLARQSRIYPNLHAGINYTFLASDKMHFTTGFGIYNITKPQQSFYNENNIKLDQRFNIHTAVTYNINNHFSLIPSILFMSQGTYKEFDIGSYFKYALVNMPYMYRAVYLGTWTRAQDAGYIVLGMDYDNLSISVSYDINYSNLVPASNAHGGYELSLIYIIKKQITNKNKKRICPEII